MNVRAQLRGGEHVPARCGVDTHAGSNSFPSPRSIFERFDILQSALDISALVFIALFLCLTAISIPVALFFLFFVAT